MSNAYQKGKEDGLSGNSTWNDRNSTLKERMEYDIGKKSGEAQKEGLDAYLKLLKDNSDSKEPVEYTPGIDRLVLLATVSVIVGYKYDAELGWITFLSPIILIGIAKWYAGKQKSEREQKIYKRTVNTLTFIFIAFVALLLLHIFGVIHIFNFV